MRQVSVLTARCRRRAAARQYSALRRASAALKARMQRGRQQTSYLSMRAGTSLAQVSRRRPPRAFLFLRQEGGRASRACVCLLSQHGHAWGSICDPCNGRPSTHNGRPSTSCLLTVLVHMCFSHNGRPSTTCWPLLTLKSSPAADVPVPPSVQGAGFRVCALG